MNYAVTVVVAIYRSEAFIERCAVSLFEQDFDDIEYLFVDDASPDNSIAILEKVIARYPQRAEQVKIIRNVNNIGLFENRKKGVMAASGEYIQHIDADDWVEKTMISTVYQKAKEENADVVACDYYYHIEGKSHYKKDRHPSERNKLLVALFQNEISSGLWGKLIKTTVHKKIYKRLNLSKRLNNKEDQLIIMPLYCDTGHIRIHYCPNAFYHYNKDNMGSVTYQYNNKNYDDLVFSFEFLCNYLRNKLAVKQAKLLRNYFVYDLLHTYQGLGQEINISYLRARGFGLFDLWQLQRLSIRRRLIYSCYFLHLPWLPRLCKQLKEFNRED